MNNAPYSESRQKKISPYALAALMIVSRLFALSMYIPSEGENAALTAVTAMVLCLFKLPMFLGAAKLFRLASKRPKILGAVLMVSAVLFIIVSADSFTDMLESVYPERLTKLAAAVVLIFACIYTASMGVEGTVRAACVILGVFTVTIIPVLFSMRGSMLTDRIDLYSEMPFTEITRSAGELLRYFAEPLIFAGLLPFAGGEDRRTAGIAAKSYLIAEALISCVLFLMHAAVMGRFFGQSGYAFFTLSYNTHGTIIDRANGVFTCVSSMGAVITIAALMLVFREGLEMMNVKKETIRERQTA